ncbi:hypothetical protein CR513_25111, partial [Mucuna pruriens]
MLYGHIEQLTELHWECHPTGLSSAMLVFNKTLNPKHRAYWAIKKCNMAYDQELEELCLEAYKNSQIYKEKDLEKGVHSQPKGTSVQYLIKTHNRWDEPFVVTDIFPYGAVEVRDAANNHTFKVNGHQLKLYHEGPNLSSILGKVDIIIVVEPIIPDDL